MGYVSYTDTKQTGAQALASAYQEISSVISKLEQSVDTLLGLNGTNAPTDAQYQAFQFIQEFSNKTGEYANVVGDKIEDLRKSVEATVEKKLGSMKVMIPDDTNGNMTPVYIRTPDEAKKNDDCSARDRGAQATYLDLLKNWNNTSKPSLFFFCWRDDNHHSSNDTYHHSAPWCNQDLNSVGTAQKDANGNDIPGGGITVDVEYENHNACDHHYDLSANGSAQALSNYVKPSIDPASAAFDYKAEINQEMIAAGLAPLSA